MMVFGLCLLFVGLQIIDIYFDLHWKEFSIGLIFLSSLITIICFMNSMTIGCITWLIVTLIEYRTYLNNIKE